MDRAALDAAIRHGLAHGGWCPQRRRAEDGTIPTFYQLQETESWEYQVRTEYNVRDSDGTLVLNLGEPDGGTALTMRLAETHGKPWLLVDLESGLDAEHVRLWLKQCEIRVLNIAGPRESKRPGIYLRAFAAISSILTGSGSNIG